MIPLTEQELEEMWKHIMRIERITERIFFPKKNRNLDDSIQYIKNKLKSVIGQME